MTEDETFRLYHHTDNSRVYHEREPEFMEIDGEDAPAVEMLIKEYPKYVTVSELNEDSERAVALIQDLYDFGLLMKKQN